MTPELGGILRFGTAAQIGRTSDHYALVTDEWPRDKRGAVRQFRASANGHVDPLGDQIDGAILQAQIYPQARMRTKQRRQMGADPV